MNTFQMNERSQFDSQFLSFFLPFSHSLALSLATKYVWIYTPNEAYLKRQPYYSISIKLNLKWHSGWLKSHSVIFRRKTKCTIRFIDLIPIHTQHKPKRKKQTKNNIKCICIYLNCIQWNKKCFVIRMKMYSMAGRLQRKERKRDNGCRFNCNFGRERQNSRTHTLHIICYKWHLSKRKTKSAQSAISTHVNWSQVAVYCCPVAVDSFSYQRVK